MDTRNLPIEEILRNITEEQKKIIEMYLDRQTQKTICASLQIPRGVIDGLVKKYNLRRFRDKKLSYCKNIDKTKPEFWYFVGLFASDGNLYYKSNAVNTIQFTMDDKDALDSVKEIIQCNNVVKKYFKQGKERYNLTVSDSSLIREIQEIFNSNCYRKTFILEFPNVPNIDCLRMFLRGFFDGDGSFTKSSIQGFYNFKIFCASKKFAKSLFNTLSFLFGSKVHFYKEAYIEINAQKEVYELCKFLYSKNENIGIARKRERAMQHIRNYELKI